MGVIQILFDYRMVYVIRVSTMASIGCFIADITKLQIMKN